MGPECQYSFDDLYQLAHQREWTRDEKAAFMALDQAGKNLEVKRLAEIAGCVRTEDRLGTDGVCYTAFWVEQHK